MPADPKSTDLRAAHPRSAAAGSSAAALGSAAAARDKALDLVLGQIERNFGKGSIMRLGDASRMRVETVSTGALTLDLALGGGYPKGRVVEIYGPESSGKTTLTLHAIAEAQRRGGVAAFVDAEHALDPVYAAALGVDVENLLVSQPDTGEMALEIVDQLVRSAAVDIVVVDSVAALTPRAEIEGEMGDLAVGSQARLMSQAMRKITGNIGKSGCTVIFLNQLRQKIGVTYGNPETTTGGNALKFYASVRLDIRRIQTLKRGTEEYGIRAKVKVAKNKVAPPFRIAEFDILFGRGISTLGCLLDLAEETAVVVRKGAWYSYEGDNIGQGRDNTITWLEQNPTQKEAIEAIVRRKLTEGADVTANSVKPLAAAAAKLAAAEAEADDGSDADDAVEVAGLAAR
ncbi:MULTISPECIES: recombinase RecA [unclassified Synechococcus]|jgi:recombination protein RecA|uniref:recombinase RecA n=1 Tax=unclassified Synechococcus TaxID=2626047 RepID=UPI000B988FD0|nr:MULTISPECIES: recombinase RecA [unclassified Synechococcus]MCP9846124.1 recombinase RecA [Synechococcus sp. Lug-A]